MLTSGSPLISIISFCKNRTSTIRRSVESVLNQTYTNLEFVIQDGASTDGTLEILREYAQRDPRIKLVSEPDSGPAEAYWKVLRRCKGEIIGTCLSDEELLPDAVEFAVETFRNEPHLGAITCDGYNTDEHGTIVGNFIAGEFDFIAYLFGRYSPLWPASFFSQAALINIGLLRPGWTLDCLEFEIWCRLATNFEVKYVPRPISKYAIHSGQLSNTPKNMNEHITARLTVIDKMFSQDGFFGVDEHKKLECMINQIYLFYNHARAHQLKEEEKKLKSRLNLLFLKLSVLSSPIHSLGRTAPWKNRQKIRYDLTLAWQRLGARIPRFIRCLLPTRLKTWLQQTFISMGTICLTGALPHDKSTREIYWFRHLWSRISFITPAAVRRALPRNLKIKAYDVLASVLLIARYFPAYAIWYGSRLFSSRNAILEQIEVKNSTVSIDLYPDVALLYDGRGQTQQALEMWRRANSLNDSTIDGLACQAALKLPAATDEYLFALHQTWATRHAMPIERNTKLRSQSFNGNRKVKIGYHCSFMNSDTIRFMMGKAFAAHDRSKFAIIGYSPDPLPSDLRNAFDLVRDTSMQPDGIFVDRVRSDQIDVFVELTGFSPGHRFSAMASRCAPVQISYLNHTSSSCVQNVDYIFADELGIPSNSSSYRYYSERIYRLPGCFFCFDYDYPGFESPPISESPFLSRGTITFGCFGSGSKINIQLIEMWAELLHRVPNSIFYVRNGQLASPANRQFMADRFQRFGIGPERLRIERGVNRAGLLACYADVDISMDTWPYCGGNTIAESLWQGVPIVTYYGDRFASRYGASLVTAAGCPELIARSKEEYIDIAVKLALDPARLVYYRQNLRRMSKENGLGDSRRFARTLEGAYLKMLSDAMTIPISAAS